MRDYVHNKRKPAALEHLNLEDSQCDPLLKVASKF